MARSSVVFGDFSGEGSLDMLMGHSGGGLAFFTTDSVAIAVNDISTLEVWTMYPNPGNDLLVVGPLKPDQSWISIFDSMGRIIEKGRVTNEWIRFDSSTWNSGVYLVVAERGGYREVKLWLKN